jgi:predicted nucleotidyltransferase
MNTQIFENICKMKRRLLPNDRMILFGSQARGDARPDSDWDLLLLLNKSKKEQSDKDKAFEFVMMGWDYETYMSVKIYTEEQWAQGKMFPFYKNVEKDGIEIN